MQGVSNVDEDYSLWVLLHQVRDVMFAAREEELRPYASSPMQAAALFIIQAIGSESTPAEIARWMLRRPNTISGLLDRMEQAGLIRRTRDLERKNMIRVTITEKGLQSYNDSMRLESIHRIMSCLSKEECQQLRSYLERLRSEALKPPAMSIRQVPFP
ncbi:MAG: MarR family transcriptional regulator [Dehalococcoidia bacterium]|nr:MarR family transcriptional regulator [Dehalococcoidia bacterium]